ncbi:MAG: acylphosphatase [Planctomycetes bacterium]|nr:acylphosphatase [Planctomycetota bacterium]
MEQGEAQERRKVHFRGRVQGVGFRYTVRGVAARFAVTGYVRNLPDGRVLLVAEGSSGELDRFLRAVSTAMDRYIDRFHETVGGATGEFGYFEIRY